MKKNSRVLMETQNPQFGRDRSGWLRKHVPPKKRRRE